MLSMALLFALLLSGCASTNPGKSSEHTGEDTSATPEVQETASPAETTPGTTPGTTTQETATPVADGYTVTQYADIENHQCMSYTIEDGKGGLIIVDGGRAWQTQTMLDTIAQKGGKVDYWIITHPHDDHCGVLCSVLAAEVDLEIGQILISDIDYDAYLAQGIRTDTYAYLMMGLEGRDDVTWLHTGDEMDLLGLHMEVLSAYDDTLPGFSSNLGNDGSLMFKLSASQDSMLFCADVGGRMADGIMERCGDKLAATYIQMPHHGNNDMPPEFYEKVNPEAAFFDAPDWLMNNTDKETGETATYLTPQNIAIMKRLGAKIYSYNTAPNSVVLK